MGARRKTLLSDFNGVVGESPPHDAKTCCGDCERLPVDVYLLDSNRRIRRSPVNGVDSARGALQAPSFPLNLRTLADHLDDR